MTLERRRVVKSLGKKGFRKKQGTAHTLFFYQLDERDTAVFTKVSRGTKYKTLGDGLVKEMAHQCRLSIARFRELVACSLSKQEYEDLIREKIEGQEEDGF